MRSAAPVKVAGALVVPEALPGPEEGALDFGGAAVVPLLQTGELGAALEEPAVTSGAAGTELEVFPTGAAGDELGMDTTGAAGEDEGVLADQAELTELEIY